MIFSIPTVYFFDLMVSSYAYGNNPDETEREAKRNTREYDICTQYGMPSKAQV